MVMVSTDDEEIADVARSYGAEIPFIRSNELSDDLASVGAVIDHAVLWLTEKFGQPEYVCMILATAPFVRAKYIRESFEKLVKDPDKLSCLGVTEFPYPIQRAVKIAPEGSLDMFTPEYFSARSQDLEKAYHDAGQFNWYRVNTARANEHPWIGNAIPYVLPSYEVQDIDTPEDWIHAEAMYKALQIIKEGA